MDIRRFARIMIALGVLLSLGAVAWWYHFFGRLAQEVKVDLSEMLPCLYSTGGACGFVSGITQLGGGTPYSPMLLWAGALLIVVGVVARFSAKA